jgi:D-serine deaminase-like pyridoxal phosphate-dependent protein
VTDSTSEVARHELAARLGKAIDALSEPPASPAYVVDVDAFDANAADLVRRAAGTPIRLASKSVRVPELIRRALDHDGFQGVLAYNLREALWLLDQGIADDIVLGYPVADRGALRPFLTHPTATQHITLMVDDVAQLDLVDSARGSATDAVRVAIDVDASFRLGRGHLGLRRSPLFQVGDVVALAKAVLARPGFTLVGIMTYEGQVAGLQDDLPTATGRARSLVVRQLKALSVKQLDERRRRIAAALGNLVALEFWNSGGSGSIETSCTPPVTEVTAGSGLLVSTIFDHYRAFDARPAAFFGLRVARRPSPDSVVVSGGGFIASGPAGKDRSPVPWAPPGLHLTGLEGAGEVQTPLVGRTAGSLALGDWVWFRHAKAGELAEHTPVAHLLSGSSIEASVPTYRGAGNTW